MAPVTTTGFSPPTSRFEDKSGFLYRVRALDDHGAIAASCEARLDHSSDFDQIAGAQGGAG